MEGLVLEDSGQRGGGALSVGEGRQCPPHPDDRAGCNRSPMQPSSWRCTGVEGLGVTIWNAWTALGRAYKGFRLQDWSYHRECAQAWMFGQCTFRRDS